MQKIILTGGSGFLGSALMQHKAFKNAIVIGRNPSKNSSNYVYKNLNPSTNYEDVLGSTDIIVHAAGLAHLEEKKVTDATTIYKKINTDVTLNLAKQAIKAGVKRFIFISSVKVLGEKTNFERPFDHKSKLNPHGPYALSKAEAETKLIKEVCKTSMDLVIIRPPLIYGKNVKGNVLKFMKLVQLQLPLPLRSIKNKRSFVSVINLVDFIVCCLNDKKARNKTFLVSDDYDLSTPELFGALALTGGFKSYLFSLPDFFLKIVFKILRKTDIYEKISDSLQIDISYTKKQMNWKPPVSLLDGIKMCWKIRR